MQEYTNEEQKGDKIEEVKKWLQENLRIVVSIVIVAIIAGGIYSYSKRVESPAATDEAAATEQTKEDNNSVEVSNKDEQGAKDQKVTTPTKEQPATKAESKETESAFVETAGKGDGTTVLARRALANYLEKNADSALTKEHKIYIEDYLRKNVPTKHVGIGSSVEFSKDLIQKALSASKNLNEKQLKHLEKYSARVANL